MHNKHSKRLQQWQRHIVVCLCLVVAALAATGCSDKGEPVRLQRFEQLIFDGKGNAADFTGTTLLNYNPDDPRFMAMLDDFRNDPTVRRIYEVTDSLYHDLAWLEQQLGDAMQRAHTLWPELDYSHFYTLVTADYNNYANRVFCDLTDMAISLDCYTLGHVAEMQRFGVPNYIARLCRREYIVADVMAAATRSHIEMPEGDMTFLDFAIAEGKTLYLLEQVLPKTADTILLRYSAEQLAWMEANVERVWGWLIEHDVLYSSDQARLRNLVDDAPKTNVFGEGSAPRTSAYIGWQIVRRYMKRTSPTLAELMAERDSRKILTLSGWRP